MTRPVEERFESKVQRGGGIGDCWLWTGTITNPAGYGQFFQDGRMVMAHRWSYEHYVGPIPVGLELDHLCRVRHCVNPAHLEPVTRAENHRRGNSDAVMQARKQAITHCPKGHPYSGDNLYYSGTKRHCRECNRAWCRARRAALKASA